MPARKIQSKKPAAKKQKVAPVVKTEYDLKLEKVVGALSNEEYPIEGGAANREMLIKGAPFVFCEFVEDRHDNQKVLGGFVDEAMAGIRTFLEGKITEQQVLADSSDARKAELITLGEQLTAAHEATMAATLAATEARDAKTALLKERKEAEKTATANAKASKAELAAAEKVLARFTRGQEIYHMLRDIGPDAKLFKELKPILNDIKLEVQGLGIYEVLPRPLDKRSFMDDIHKEGCNLRFAATLAECNAKIAEITTRDAPLLDAITTASAAIEEATLLLEQATTALNDAKAAQRAADMAKKDNEAAVLNHDNDVAAVDENKLRAELNLKTFAAIEEDLAWLKVRTVPVPEPEPVEEAPAEEVPADVSMAEAPVAETTAETEAAPVEAAPIEEPIIEEAPLEVPLAA